MFLANLTLLEEGIDVSYNGCFKHDTIVATRRIKRSHKPLIIMMSTGYADKYRKDVLILNIY